MKAVDAILFAELSDGSVRQVPLPKADRLAVMEYARQLQGKDELNVIEAQAPFAISRAKSKIPVRKEKHRNGKTNS